MNRYLLALAFVLVFPTACKDPATSKADTCPAEQITEATCATDAARCPKPVVTTQQVQGASLLGGALPGGAIISAAVSSVAPYSGDSHVLFAASVSEHTRLADGEPDAPGVSTESVVLMDLALPTASGDGPITTTSMMRVREPQTGMMSGKRTHAIVAPLEPIEVSAANAAIEGAIAATNSTGAAVHVAAATAMVVAHPRDGLKLFGLRVAGAGEVTLTEPISVGSQLTINNAMPNRISMNVTVPKQTQGATFGEKVNAGLHAAGSALAQGAARVSVFDTDMFRTRDASSSRLAADPPLALGDAELVHFQVLGDAAAPTSFVAGLASSPTCPVALAGVPALERPSDTVCDFVLWEVTSPSGTAPTAHSISLVDGDQTPIIRGSALLAATVIETAGEPPRFKVALYDATTRSVAEHLVAPLDTQYTVTTRTLIEPLDASVTLHALDARYDHGGLLWLVEDSSTGTQLRAGKSAPLSLRASARTVATGDTPFVSLALFHGLDRGADAAGTPTNDIVSSARPRRVGVLLGGAAPTAAGSSVTLLMVELHAEGSPVTADLTEIEANLKTKTTHHVSLRAGVEVAAKLN